MKKRQHLLSIVQKFILLVVGLIFELIKLSLSVLLHSGSDQRVDEKAGRDEDKATWEMNTDTGESQLDWRGRDPSDSDYQTDKW